MSALAEAATSSPREPGVYFFLGPERDLLYVGKAADLHRPHLARGASSHVAKRTKVGYTALLRLLWSAGSSAPCPARIAGSSPPARVEAALAPESRALLHDFLSGRRARLLPALQAAIARADIPAFTRSALSNDFGAAREFFELGPARVRRFRLRHALPPGPVPAGQMANLLAQEVRDAIGDFQPGAPCPDAALLGRRGVRQRQLRDRLRV